MDKTTLLDLLPTQDTDVNALDNPPTTPQPSLGQLFRGFLRLGATAFGGPAMVAYIRRMAVEQQRWLEAGAFDDGVALCQMIPGATAMQTAAYIGLRVRGARGAAACFVGFGLPAFVLMMLLAALYEEARALPAVIAAFDGLRAVIVALVANAAVTVGKTTLKHWWHGVVAGVAGALFALGASPFLVVIAAGLLGLMLRNSAPGRRALPPATARLPHTTKAVGMIVAVAVAAWLTLWFTQQRLAELAALMARIDLFAFGGGFASVPLMFREVVEVRRWLDGRTLLDGIVLGQVTPGPIVIAATFIGSRLAGVAGGVAATVGVFLPSFLMVIGLAPHFDRLRTSPMVNRCVSGVLCSFVGLLLTVTGRFAQNVAWNWPHALLAVAALIALRLKVDVLWLVLVGTGFSVLLCG
jgi:chromate transporter